MAGQEVTERDWWMRRVDMRCRECGATAAGSAWCFRCGSTDLELRVHADTPDGEVPWCRRDTKPDEERATAPVVGVRGRG